MEKPTRAILDETKCDAICAILAAGGTRAVAAQFVGCHVRTIARHAQRDPKFAEALRQAEIQHELVHLKHIHAATKEGRHWRASAWALERAYPNRYGRRLPQTITVEQISQVLEQLADVILDEVTESEQQERILARLSELTAEFQGSAAKGDQP